MNTLHVSRDAEPSMRLRGASRLFGRSAVLVALFCLVSGTALAREDFCTRTAQAALTACRHEVADNFSTAIGRCINLSDPTARAECRSEAKIARDDGQKECSENRKGRAKFCQALGEARHDPEIDPAMFVDPTQIGTTVAPNPYFLLIPGRTMVYKSDTEKIDVEVTAKTREILGVTCATVHDVVRDNNGEVIEDTIDWYAQDIDGNVWYFGESSQRFEDGVMVSIDGSWMTGMNGDKPGIAMKAAPALGETYRQEFSLGNAEDGAEVISLTGSVTVPAASCSGDCLITREFSPMSAVDEQKYFVPDVGFILTIEPGERLELVDIIQN